MIMLGVPRERRLGRRVVSRNVDYVLENTPCRVLVTEGAKAKSK